MSTTEILIALETSGACCGVALLRAQGDEVTLRVREHTGTQTHAERLLPMLDELLGETGVARAAIQAVAFGQGPGGFTGLRVAAGVAQGLALALDVPVLPVASHRAVASQMALREDEVAVVALDARMDEAYVAAYGSVNDGTDDAGDWRALQAPILLPAAALAAWSAAQLLRWSHEAGRTLSGVAAGDGWDMGDARLPSGFSSTWRREAADLYPNADSVARVAWRDWRAGRAVAPEEALPLYVRDKVAYTTAERAGGAGGNPRAECTPLPPVGAGLGERAAPKKLAAMTMADLPDVARLEASVQPHPWTRGNFADALAAGYGAWVLRENGRLLGFAVLMAAPDVAHVLTIAVARDAQRRGLGRRLLRHCEAHARKQNVPGLLLEVRVSNTAARAFYEHAGFAQIGMRRGYYPMKNGQREDALVLQKMLPAAQAQQEQTP